MKNLMMTLLSFAVVAATGTMAHAEAYKDMDQARFNLFNFQAGTGLAGKSINRGYVTIEKTEKEVSITMYRHIRCPPGAMCSMMVPAPVIFNAKLKSVKRGGCNQLVYTAVSDLRRVDGILTRIAVVDNSENNCLTIRALAPVEVILQLKGGRQNFDETHTFEADPLVAVR